LLQRPASIAANRMLYAAFLFVSILLDSLLDQRNILKQLGY